jgi:adenine-specific DNA glycosylase
VKEFCAAKTPEKLPVKSPKAPVKERSEYAAWVSDGKTILLQQSTARRWVGLWRLPPLETEPPGGPAAELTYSIVRERVKLRIHRASERALAASAERRKPGDCQGAGRIA